MVSGFANMVINVDVVVVSKFLELLVHVSEGYSGA